MDILKQVVEPIVYGIVQGLTEFLPISSSAHLRIVPALLHWEDRGAAFTAVIQLGTVAAMLIVFGPDLWRAIVAWAKSITTGDRSSVDARIGWGVFIGTFPIVIAGLLLKKYIEGPFRSLYVIAASLIIMAILMGLAEKFGKKDRTLDKTEIKDGLIVGLWQTVALIPGMSRSGSTITGALFAGLDRNAAARFSFLLSVPAITMAGLKELYDNRKEFSGEMLSPVLIATAVSFVVGYFAIKWLLKFLQEKGIGPFIIYRIALGVLIIALCASGQLNPNETPAKPLTAQLTHFLTSQPPRM